MRRLFEELELPYALVALEGDAEIEVEETGEWSIVEIRVGFGVEKIALDNTPHGPALSEMIRAALLADSHFVESVDEEITSDREADADCCNPRYRSNEHSTYRVVNGSVG